MKLRLALLGLAALAAAAVGACSATTRVTTFNTGGSTGSGGPSGSGGMATSGTSGLGGNFVASVGSGTSTGSGCQTHCSADLHSVVDCNGTVISTCPPDQGCGAMGCVPACQSAQENKSTIGCDYYSVDPDIIQEAAGACFAAYIANTWGSPVTINVDRAGQTFNAATFSYIPVGTGQSIVYNPLPNGQLPPGEVAIVFLASTGAFAACPPGVNIGLQADGAVHGTGLGDAFHITTSAPVVAYDIFPYGGGQSAATSATLLLPSTSWDTNYIAVDAFQKSVIVPEAQPFIEIVASMDGTQVTISPTAPIVGGPGVQPTGQGQPAMYTINKGQVLQFTQDAELIGSVIQSNNPVGVWGGESCLNIDVNTAACDSAHQQIPPIKALGFEYVAVRYRNRFDGMEETVPWRLVGAVDGTLLTYDPAAPPGAPTTLNSGEVVQFMDPGPFTVKSQGSDHPFYMAAHMTGCETVSANIGDCRGDPEFVNVIPPQEYLASYVFFTDPTYPETNLVFVRENPGAGFQDVTLDCAGVLTGWMPLDMAGKYQYTRTDLVRHDFQPQGNCDNGRHEVHSNAPFGLTVWGWGTAEASLFSQAVSYAYPAGASVQPINTIVVPPIPK